MFLFALIVQPPVPYASPPPLRQPLYILDTHISLISSSSARQGDHYILTTSSYSSYLLRTHVARISTRTQALLSVISLFFALDDLIHSNTSSQKPYQFTLSSFSSTLAIKGVLESLLVVPNRSVGSE